MLVNKTLWGCSLLLFTFSVSVGHTEEIDVEEENNVPKVRKMRSDETSLDEEFQSFKKGGFFFPPAPHLKKFMGYASKKNLFKDFREHFESGGDDGKSIVSLCDGESGESDDASVKISFECEDAQVEYSCYVDVVDGKYALNIPAEVRGLSCKIAVEAIEVTADEEDVEVDGVETEDEIVLDDSTIEIDVEE